MRRPWLEALLALVVAALWAAGVFIILLAAVLAIGIVVNQARAMRHEPVWLALCIDASLSVPDESYALQREGYVRVLSDPEVVSAFGGVLTVWAAEFSKEVRPLFDWTPIAGAGAQMAAAPARSRGGTTGVHECLRAALDALEGREGKLIIDVSLDAKENVDSPRFAAEVERAESAGVTINVLALPSLESRFEEWVSSRLVTGRMGFYMGVAKWEEFARAFRAKLFAEVS